jgi:hypothetical protein
MVNDRPSKLIFGGMGLLFTLIGLGLGVLAPTMIYRNMQRVATLEPLSMAALSARAPGDAVLLEGRISERNETQWRGYVAYIREEYVRETGSGDNSRSDYTWETDLTVTPPLLIDLPDGSVQVANDGYGLGTRKEFKVANTREGQRRFSGLQLGDPVVAFGTLRSVDDGVAIAAEVVSRGTKAQYLADERMWIYITGALGGMFLLVGLFLLGVLLWGVLRGKRAPAPRPAFVARQRRRRRFGRLT